MSCFFIVSDRPALKDLANYVVPRASARWYYLGLQLFDQQDEGLLHSMKMETNKPPQEQCTEVFSHWLRTKENATWKDLIKDLNCPSVNLPNVARSVETMLDNHVSYCYRQLLIIVYKYMCTLTQIHKHYYKVIVSCSQTLWHLLIRYKVSDQLNLYHGFHAVMSVVIGLISNTKNWI